MGTSQHTDDGHLSKIMQDQTKRQRTFSRRTLLLGGAKLFLLGAVLGRFYNLQVRDQSTYSNLSENNSVKFDLIPAKRGLIYDRNGTIIVTNKCIYNAILKHDSASAIHDVVQKVQEILGRNISITQNKRLISIIEQLKTNKNDIVIEGNLSWRDVSKLELAFVSLAYDGFEIVEEYLRHYPYQNSLSHVLGYVGEPSIGKVHKNVETKYYQCPNIGKSGIEKIFNNELCGKPGQKKYLVDATGKKVINLSTSMSETGNPVTLTIDVSIQQKVQQIMGNLTGAVVVMKPQSGQIVALYSAPSYDPNLLSNGIEHSTWQKILTDTNKPLLNRAITATYPPGSTFKIVSALAILRAGINQNETVFCNGTHIVNGRMFHCWKSGGHGNVDMRKAIAMSCNVYFYTNGLRAGISNIAHIARVLGFGHKTGIELPYESEGCIPDKVWKKDVKKEPWTYCDTANAAIGQGYITVTPIQLAMALSRIITGQHITPVLKLGTQHRSYTSYSDSQLDIHASNRLYVMDCMGSTFSMPGGTGYAHRMNKANVKIAGKTGTAQIISQRKNVSGRFKEHGIFIGYAPSDDPEYVISVVVEHGISGGSSALIIAKNLLVDLCTENL